MKRFSYSSLGSFKKCPQQFKIYYLDKVVKPDQGIEAFVGIIVHKTLEYLYQEVVKGNIPILDIILEKYEELWKKAWHKRIAIYRYQELY